MLSCEKFEKPNIQLWRSREKRICMALIWERVGKPAGQEQKGRKGKLGGREGDQGEKILRYSSESDSVWIDLSSVICYLPWHGR